MINWHIGCSGFHYKHWKGPFYALNLPQRKWFDFYCEHFKTLELNVTFYRFPRLPALQKWYDSCPPDFRFSVKAPKAITHYKKFKDSTAMITSFYDTINTGLQAKLGPVLFQMPPNFLYSEERLERVISNLDPVFNNVVEFRHESWWRKDVYETLASNQIAFCGMSHPLFPDDIVQNTATVYYRFHGVPDLYRSPYDIASLQAMADSLAGNESVKEAWLYFNNDIDASAITNAKQLIAISDNYSSSLL